ncbi:hypothetical protein LLG96_09105 [bacterium]|nr:hypothetical protein [bacterium]
MKAGTAKAVITPEKPYPLTSGKLQTGEMRPPEGKTHDLYARVLVLNDGTTRLVIVTYDMNSFDVATPILRERCRDKLGIDPSCLLLIATHNHQAPMPRWAENFPHQRWLAEKVFGLIKTAIANEQGPVNLFFGSGNGYFIRSSGNAPVDYEVQVLKVMYGDKVLAMLFNHPTHVMTTADNIIDVGHPGYAMDEIERQIPGVLALYGDACGANQFVIPPEGVDKPEGAKIIGSQLARIVLDIANGSMEDITGPISSKMEVIPLPFAPPPSYEEALALAKDVPLDIGIVHGKNRDTNWIRTLLSYYKEGMPFPTKSTDLVCIDEGYLTRKPDKPRAFPCRIEEVIAAKIGPMPLVVLQGEVCAPIGMRIKDTFRCSMPIMVFAYMGEQNIYIPTRELVRLDAYQSQVIRIQYGSPCGWAPEVEDDMVNGVIELVKSTLEK